MQNLNGLKMFFNLRKLWGNIYSDVFISSSWDNDLSLWAYFEKLKEGKTAYI